MNAPDYSVENHGSIYLVRPLTVVARKHLNAHCPRDGEHSYMGNALAVEPRYVRPLVDQLLSDGFAVDWRQL